LFKIMTVTQGVSLWCFHVYIYIITPLAQLFYFSSFYLSPFLMVVSTGLKILCSFLYRKYVNHVHLCNFLLLPSLSCVWPPLSMTNFS
jgi:hypothetical protein